ncbi:MAG: histidine--tRNA ligase [Mycoplasmataceae bacterium]|nr:histidine--tRNA ligase [Mycoplasmataceae bacterium]
MIQRPRGTKDIYGKDELIYKLIFDSFEQLATTYNLKKIITPTFESYELFKKINGEQTDIVSKEIYRFTDQSSRELALKPEGTASIGRAIIENKLYLSKEYNKLYYIDSMYRYEKPQKGRLRQFYQIGVELINELCLNSILDSIVLANSFLKKIKIDEYVLYINNIGSSEERNQYIKSLKTYFSKFKNQLSEISQKRIDTNPLRILDDKTDSELEIVKNAPKIIDFLSNETKEEFSLLLSKLEKLNINYKIDYSLVRGLDYYSNVVFEFVSTSSSLGSKNTLIGGGSYLDLTKTNDSFKINGVGFGIGVERIFEILKSKQDLYIPENKIDVFIIFENNSQYDQLQKIIYDLRFENITIEFNYKIKKFKKGLEDAFNSKSKIIIFQELNQHKTNNWTFKINNKNFEVNESEIKKTIMKYLFEN